MNNGIHFFIIKPTRCTNFTDLFWHEAQHVSDNSSVHHQEFIHCKLSNGIRHTGLLTAFEQEHMLSVQWMNAWWWTEELSETCRVSCQNEFVKLVHLVGFITKKFVMMHGHVTTHGHMSRRTVTSRRMVTCHDARSRVTMHGHVSRCTVTCHDARSHEVPAIRNIK